MNRTEHLLTCFSEECAEVAQRVSKALRFSLSEIQPGQELTNEQRIEAEFHDLIAADIRNLLGAFNFIERTDLVVAGFGLNAIEGFMRDPVKAFPRLPDEKQDAIARIINRNFGKDS